MKRFKDIKEKDYIVRVYGYKVESAKVLKIEKAGKDKLSLTIKTTETNETMTISVDTTSTMIGRIDGNKFYADTDVLEGLRDGIEISATYARKLMIESFRPMIPFFKSNKEFTKDLEVMNRICEKEYKEQLNSYYDE
jgi:hypothetical protein